MAFKIKTPNKMSNRRQIRKGWEGAGRKCTVLGEDVEVNGMNWTPIVFDDEEDPDWYKSSSLEEIKEPSHTQQEPERIWVSHFCEHDTLKGNKCDSWFYQFCLSKEIGRDKFPSIKEAIEKVLNPSKCRVCGVEVKTGANLCGEHWSSYEPPLRQPPLFETKPMKDSDVVGLAQEIKFNSQTPSSYDGKKLDKVKFDEHGQWEEPKRDWEIIEVRNKNTQLIRKKSHWGQCDWQEKVLNCIQSFDIISVRRLSDGQTFFEDDITDFGRISGFSICGNHLMALFEGGSRTTNICNLKKLPPKPQVLFTTEDGFSVFPECNHQLWYIRPNIWEAVEIYGQNYWCQEAICNTKKEAQDIGANFVPKNKWFSTKESAEEYILMNKPCLSVSDILALWPLSPEPKNAIVDLAKFKQKQPTT